MLCKCDLVQTPSHVHGDTSTVCSRRMCEFAGSVLLEFNLDQLKSFAWSEDEEEMKQLQECADANATACNTDSEAPDGACSRERLSTVRFFQV